MDFFDFDATRERLLTLIAERQSIRQIAQALGTTPGSVSGHFHRNPDLRPQVKTKIKPKPTRPSAPARYRTFFNGASNPARQEPKSIALTEVRAKEGYRVPLQDIARHGRCRWPVADDPSATPHGIICCGAPTAEGKVYCPAHRKVAYAKPQAPRGFRPQAWKPRAITTEHKVRKENA